MRFVTRKHTMCYSYCIQIHKHRCVFLIKTVVYLLYLLCVYKNSKAPILYLHFFNVYDSIIISSQIGTEWQVFTSSLLRFLILFQFEAVKLPWRKQTPFVPRYCLSFTASYLLDKPEYINIIYIYKLM